MKADLVAYCALTFLVLAAVAERFGGPSDPGPACRVGYVYDGDSVELICGWTRETARLLDIDTPELEGRCALESAAAKTAKAALTAMVRQAATVEIDVEGRDKYDRPLIRLRLDGKDAAAALIAAGQGRPYDGGHRAGWCG